MRVTNRWLDDPEEEFNPLSVEEARQWRLRQRRSPAWYPLAWQLGIGLIASIAIGLGWQSGMLARSAAYGVCAVVFPQALQLRGMADTDRRWRPEALLLRFIVWEAVKIALTLAILYGAHTALGEFSWPALLAGLVVTMKANWFLLVFQTAHRSPDGKG